MCNEKNNKYSDKKKEHGNEWMRDPGMAEISCISLPRDTTLRPSISRSGHRDTAPENTRLSQLLPFSWYSSRVTWIDFIAAWLLARKAPPNQVDLIGLCCVSTFPCTAKRDGFTLGLLQPARHTLQVRVYGALPLVSSWIQVSSNCLPLLQYWPAWQAIGQ